MTRNLYLKRLVLILAIALSGCVRDATLKPSVERKVVVEFVLTEDAVQSLYLSLTRIPGEGVAPVIQEADIKLINVSKPSEPEHRFVKAADNRWTLDYSGIPGDEYRLEVRADGYDLIWAEQRMPEKVLWVEAAIRGHGTVPKYVSYGHFYYVDNIPEYLIVRGIKRNKETGEYDPVETLCTDYPGVDPINATGQFYEGNPKWRTTGPGWIQTETGWEGADYYYHDRPVDGKDGIWTFMFPNLIGKPLFKDFLFITRVDDHHAGHEYLLFSSLSPDYSRFLKDTWQLKKVHEGGDLSSIYLRDNIHSNIQGGLGLFGAMFSARTNFYGANVESDSIQK